MYLTRHHTERGPRWAVDGHFLPDTFDLRLLLSLHAESVREFLNNTLTTEKAAGVLLPPLEPIHEVWGCGPIGLRPRDQRRSGSRGVAPPDRTFSAERPVLYYKSSGWRVVGPAAPVRVRDDSALNVTLPHLTLVINRHCEVVGYTAGNDMTARSLEDENPRYLAQAKVYNGACALGPGIVVSNSADLRDLPISLEIDRAGRSALKATASTADLDRPLEDLIGYLARELDFPHGVLLLAGSPVRVREDFTLSLGDRITITLGALTLENEVTG